LPVARRLLETTDRGFRLVVSDSWVAGLFRTQILARIAALAMRQKRLQHFAFRTISQTGIRYRSSPLSQSAGGFPGDAPRAGDRFPWAMLTFEPDGTVQDLFKSLDDTRFNLLAIGQPAPSAEDLGLRDLLRIHPVPADPANDGELKRLHIPQPSFYLLRPDGYVGLSGARLDTADVRRYVAEHLRVGPAITQ
jgi:hypothetical protein